MSASPGLPSYAQRQEQLGRRRVMRPPRLLVGLDEARPL